MNMDGTTYFVSSPVYFIVRDAPSENERLLFHIRTGDYFAMVATALGFVEEALETKEEDTLPSPELSVLRQIKKDLLFLHAHYDICEKQRDDGGRMYR